ncbi:MAG: ChaN family lipoprotein [Myxococcota bacterium]|nr:ChaN family lipoprotein [Myxococcota bacterium]
MSLIALTALGGCAGPHAARSPRAQQLCGPQIPGAQELLRPASLVLLGEMHGTNEIPYVVAELACEAATSGQRVTVGVEMGKGEQAALELYLDSQGTPDDQRRLVAGPFWNRPYQDGRSSKAMAAMLERLRLLKSAGLGIRVVAYDVPRRSKVAQLPPPQPANQHLLGTDPAPGAVYDPHASFRGYRPFVRLSAQPSPEGYHGYFYVGPITPSPPATTASFGPG